ALAQAIDHHLKRAGFARGGGSRLLRGSGRVSVGQARPSEECPCHRYRGDSDTEQRGGSKTHSRPPEARGWAGAAVSPARTSTSASVRAAPVGKTPEDPAPTHCSATR